jgi:asparagine synthase (glutamine-hydrolysing)
MCGIAGLYNVAGGAVDIHLLEAMTRLQAHRGPDGEGYVLLSPGSQDKPITVSGPLHNSTKSLASSYQIGFGHRRLAVVDLTPLGRQPMGTEDGRCWITYNGEIYNAQELRRELERLGYWFRSSSDTEVVLASYRQWGAACVDRMNGMFAFALWDGDAGRLFCARDRFGEKPFYYHWDGRVFRFASEIKALLPSLPHRSANLVAVYNYLDRACQDDGSHTFFSEIQQLLPAHTLLVDEWGVRCTSYWNLSHDDTGDTCSLEEAARQLHDIFSDSIRLRLRSDVPIGSCLSGGLDSSTIVCVANEIIREGQAVPSHLIGARQKTFSACFNDVRYDERPYIESVVKKTGVEAHFVFPDSGELLSSLQQLVWHQDEPFGGTSIFAQWTVLKMAAQEGVKVVLDGQGADELLCGYHGFFGAHFAELLWNGHWGDLLREQRAYCLRHGSAPPQVWANVARGIFPAKFVDAGRRWLGKSRQWLHPEFSLVSKEMDRVCEFPEPPVRAMERRLIEGNGLRALLHYEDRNAMAFGIETRLPFLDHRLAEFLFQLPATYKMQRGWTKVVLRQAMGDVLPRQVCWRADKIGFATPEADWLRTSLREFVRELLRDRRTRERGLLDVNRAQDAFEDHVAGRRDLSSIAWRWVNAELWYRQFMDHSPILS